MFMIGQKLRLKAEHVDRCHSLAGAQLTFDGYNGNNNLMKFKGESGFFTPAYYEPWVDAETWNGKAWVPHYADTSDTQRLTRRICELTAERDGLRYDLDLYIREFSRVTDCLDRAFQGPDAILPDFLPTAGMCKAAGVIRLAQAYKTLTTPCSVCGRPRSECNTH